MNGIDNVSLYKDFVRRECSSRECEKCGLYAENFPYGGCPVHDYGLVEKDIVRTPKDVKILIKKFESALEDVKI